MTVGHSKHLSNGELAAIVLLFQQSGIFWLLPYFLVRENGSIGLAAILAGMIVALLIIAIGRYRQLYTSDGGFIATLTARHKVAGALIGSAFVVFYLLFALLTLYSLVDVTQKQLLPNTPHIILCTTVAALTGWISHCGLEAIVRLYRLCIASLVLLITVSIAGSVDVFAIENALPLQMHNLEQMKAAAVHSIFCYSGFLMLFMLYPAGSNDKHLSRSLVWAMIGGTALQTLWLGYALGVLGEYSMQTNLWIPVQLARMVRIGTLLEQMESVMIVLWMIPVLAGGSLLVWCCSEGLHQMMQSRYTLWIHWSIAVILWIGMHLVRNSIRMLQLEYVLAYGMLLLLPLLLGAVLWLIPKRRMEQ